MNFKSSIENSGNPLHQYPYFVLLSTHETENNLVCYMLKVMDPSPIVEFKFKIHISDPVNENDFLTRDKGENTVRRQNHFK